MATFVGVTLSGPTPRGEEAVSAILVMIASVFLLSGFAVPSLEPRLAGMTDWLTSYRYHRTIYPLWHAFYEAVPSIALDPPSTRWQAVWSPRDVKFRTLRRVIEIRDGRLAICPYIDPSMEGEARRQAADAGLTSDRLEAAIEAAQIAAGLQAIAGGVAPSETDEPPTLPGFREISAELRWLSRVAAAFTSQPKVPVARPVASQTANETR